MSFTVSDSPPAETFPKLLGEYHRRRPEQTVLYQCVQENYRSFLALYEEQDRVLPAFVRREFEATRGSATGS